MALWGLARGAYMLVLCVALDTEGRANAWEESSGVGLLGCESAYWQWAQARLFPTGQEVPNSSAIEAVLAEEENLVTPSDASGCELGRFVVSLWQLVYATHEERSWNLRNRFGIGVYGMPWRPRRGWPLMQALAQLRQRVLADPRDAYPANRCDLLSGAATPVEEADAQFLAELGSISVVPPAALAARVLTFSRGSQSCPFAVAAAYWSLALALLANMGNSHTEKEAMQIWDFGEQAARTWETRRAPFLDLLTTVWPLWNIAAKVEQRRIGGSTPSSFQFAAPVWPSLKTGQEAGGSDDPLNPRCERPPRERLVRGLEAQRVEAVVVYGRRDRVEILHRYLLRNLKVNGGLLDKVIFVVYAAMEDDLRYLNELVEKHAPFYVIPPVEGRRLAKIYSVCTDPETIYLKLDDDLVYISDEAIPDMVRERLRGRCSFVSANVVNHAILSAVHQDIGAIRNFFPLDDMGSPRQWAQADDMEPPLAPITKRAQSDCVWRMWECAAWMHESLLSRLADGTQCAYDFGWHDFHAHGFGREKGDKFVPLAYTRWSINMIAFKVADLGPASPLDLAEDDESELSYVVPNRLGVRACAVGRALVAHYSYTLQDEELHANTDILERYHNLSLLLTSGEGAAEVQP